VPHRLPVPSDALERHLERFGPARVHNPTCNDHRVIKGEVATRRPTDHNNAEAPNRSPAAG
jgi:hypothetical protein